MQECPDCGAAIAKKEGHPSTAPKPSPLLEEPVTYQSCCKYCGRGHNRKDPYCSCECRLADKAILCCLVLHLSLFTGGAIVTSIIILIAMLLGLLGIAIPGVALFAIIGIGLVPPASGLPFLWILGLTGIYARLTVRNRSSTKG